MQEILSKLLHQSLAVAAVVVLIWHRPAVRIRQELMNYLQKYQKFLKDRLNKKLCKKFNFIIDAMRCMCDIPLAGRIIRAVADAVSVPVTVKTRLGWDRSCPSAVALARVAEENGAAAITVHGRTKAMLYSGRADWDAIGEVVRAVSIPVIANGDISDPEQLLRCRAHSGASLFMAGRAAFGDPWLFERLRAALRGKTPPELPPLADRVDTALQQFALALEDKGEHIACLEARKHFAWYLRGVTHRGFSKEQISNISAFSDKERLAKEIKRDLR